MSDAINALFCQYCLPARQCTGASFIQHSPTVAVQNCQLPYSWAMAHNSNSNDYKI